MSGRGDLPAYTGTGAWPGPVSTVARTTSTIPCPATISGRPGGRSIPSTRTTGRPDNGSVSRFPESTKAVRAWAWPLTVRVTVRVHLPSYPRWTK